MDKFKTNNNKEHAVIASIECPYTNAAVADAVDVDVESNKSTPTPYFTPLDYLQTSFEFPSPTATAAATTTTSEPRGGAVDEEAQQYTPKQFTIANPKQQQHQQSPLPQSPTTLNRKFKRFSLYDRRSCSPQQQQQQQEGRIFFANKENTIPKKSSNDHENDHDSLYLSKSEHNSPTILFRDDSATTTTATNATPNLLNNDAASRLSYSPKLLASINNLNLNHSLAGSPLNIINSAGYKNGNFFRFPEIDQVVQDAVSVSVGPAATIEEPDNQQQQQQPNDATTANVQQESGRRNRKNKNNLTIRITDVQLAANKTHHQQQPSPSTLAKPKTPTIKSTKEKARSLDSAANETELSIVVQHINESHDMSNTPCSSGHVSQGHMLIQPTASSLHSTSLSRLDTQQSLHIRRTTRRKSPGGNSSDWQMYHRKQNPYQSSLDADELKSASSVDSSGSGSSKFSLGANLAPRSAHKLNPLLHSSSTNLKTLPECLTLVEFTPSTSVESPFKQKSMDLPGSMQTKSMASSMNLLQRRGSNHSLTLNLHSSCGNLMNSGLSVSNYSLGSVTNSKSSCNLEQQQQQQHHLQLQQPHNQLTVAAGSAQCTRQGLFRRRGSNHSITLKSHTTNSCGELNSMANQTPKRGLLERRGSNQSLTLNMSGHNMSTVGGHEQLQLQQLQLEQPKLTVCSCGAAAGAQAPHQRKFFSTENLNSNRGSNSSQYLDFSSKQPLCFGSASDLQPSEPLKLKSPAGHADASVVLCSCSCATGVVGTAGVAGGIRNIMTRPLSPQTTSEEFKSYLASIQMLQSASNPLNQFDLIKLNHVFDHSYKANLDQPPVLVLGREGGTPTNQLPPTSEDSELLAMYQAVVKSIVTSLPQLDGDEQKRIFRDLHKEFWDLPPNHQEKPMVFGSQTKNRYKTILPNEHSRVLLESEATELLNLKQQHQQSGLMPPPPPSLQAGGEELNKATLLANEDLPYINANYIKGPDYVSKCYVASQGPLPNTIFEFWLMVYQNTQRYIRRCLDGGSSPHVDKSHILQQYYQKIVMLTNFTESNRNKCAVYFPIEVNELFAVAAKGEVFELSALAREYFEPHLLPTTPTLQSEDLDELHPERERDTRWNIAVDSAKVTLNEPLRRTLPADGSFFLVKNVGIVRRNGYSVRKLVLLYCINVPESAGRLEYYLQKICCYHYWYPDWPDHHSPRDINTLLDTCLHVLNLGKCESEFDNYDEQRSTCNAHLMAQRLDIYKQDIFNAVQPLPIIHCSAGIGRTGCFTAIMNAVRQLRQSLAYSLTGMLSKTLTMADMTEAQEASQHVADVERDTESSFSCNTILHIRHIVEQSEGVSFDKLPKMPDIFVDILGIVCNLRLQRGGMVQNSEQYELIHRAICLYLKRTLALRRF